MTLPSRLFALRPIAAALVSASAHDAGHQPVQRADTEFTCERAATAGGGDDA